MGGGEFRNIEGRFEAETHAHGRRIRIRNRRCPMAGGRSEGLTRLGHGEAESVMDGAGGDFVIASEAGKDGQAGGVDGSAKVPSTVAPPIGGAVFGTAVASTAGSVAGALLGRSCWFLAVCSASTRVCSAFIRSTARLANSVLG